MARLRNTRTAVIAGLASAGVDVYHANVLPTPAIAFLTADTHADFGVMLSAFGVFWTGEGLGVAWPGADLAIVAFAALFLLTGLAAVPLARRPRMEIVS